jgi:hypothetical protein
MVNLSLFACPRPFQGQTAIHQRNALTSWAWLWPPVDGVLLGDEYGTWGMAMEAHFAFEPFIAVDPFGTPLVSSIFERGEALGECEIVAYVNADIMLMNDFVQAVMRVSDAFSGPFLMVGQRTDLQVDQCLTFTEGWGDRLRQRAVTEGVLHQAAGVDYFVYRKGTLGPLPDFALGRQRWDNWIVWHVLDQGYPVINATDCVLAVHPNHDTSHQHAHNGQQRRMNDNLVRLTGGRLCTIADATHQMHKIGVVPVKS